MFPVCLGAIEMGSAGDHKGKWHPLAISIPLVTVRDPARDLCVCDLRVMLGKPGRVCSPDHTGGAWGERGGQGREALCRSAGIEGR